MINIRDFFGLGYYVSELDTFLAEYEKKHPTLSASQRQEVEKFTRICQLRDNPLYQEKQDDLWMQF